MVKRPLRIGIDARFYGPVGKGLGRYVQELVENLQKIDQKNEYVIFLKKENFDLFRPRNSRFTKKLAEVDWYSVGEQFKLPSIFSRERLDLLHVPHFNVPVFYRGKTVITIHDLIKHDWGSRSATTRAYPIFLVKHLGYRFVTSVAIRRADAIVTPSNYVKKKVAETFRVDPKKITVTYEAGTLTGKERTREEKKVENVLGKLKISKPYFLYVGNVYPYKNVGRLLDAIKILSEEMDPSTLLRTGEAAQLVLVGARDVFRDRLEREIVQKGVLKYVVLTGYVADADLIDLYREAEAYVHPSLEEGFGLGPVEAMSLGTPVVQADISCLPEVGGDAALYFDPYDPRDIAEKLKTILSNKALRQKLARKGVAQAKKYSWEKMARETLQVYKRVARDV